MEVEGTNGAKAGDDAPLSIEERAARLSAATGATEMEVDEGKAIEEEHHEEAKPPVSGDEDQKERTRLGRNVKALQDKVDALTEALNRMMESGRMGAPVAETGQELPEIITTAEDVKKVLDAERKREQQATAQEQSKKMEYGMTYLKTLDSFGDVEGVDEVLHVEAAAECQKAGSPFNRILTGDPKTDARLNYEQALEVVKARLAAKPKANTLGDRSLPTGASASTTKGPTQTQKTVTLSPEAAEYVRRRGLKDDFVSKALQGNTEYTVKGQRMGR
jgi:hypothetical protein